jgi:nitrilase
MRTRKDLTMSDLVAPEAEKPAEAGPLPTEAVPKRFTVAAVQAAPVFLDRAATVEKACRLIAEAGAAGAKLVVFPETFIPTYPLWVWSIPAGDTRVLRELYAELLAAAVTVPGPDVDRIGAAAREAGTTVAIGVNERAAEGSGSTLYDTIVYLGADGCLLGKHRKLVPTTGERLVYGLGDGSTLDVWPLPIGRLGGLVCWENYMPLARYSLYAQGVELYLAPTWDRGEPWISTLRHIAKEGRVYVIGVCIAIRRDQIPDSYPFKQLLPDSGAWLNPGDSAIVDPDGKLLAGPAHEEETILYAEVDLSRLRGARFQLDVAGHYARPDVFELTVHREERPLIRFAAPSRGPRPTPRSGS